MSEPLFLPPRLSIGYLKDLYASGMSPEVVFDEILSRIEKTASHNIWISRLSREEIAHWLSKAPKGRLYGIPFAIKDNIDLEGVPTTAGCSEFSYVPKESAPVVDILLKEGAIPLGKTNLDQFATGLVGTRSPYGICRNSYDQSLLSGGSSSGSGVSVAMGMACFSLGTDTAGSGRVPAALNGILGWKPSKGLLSTRGVVPACKSLDCVSIFANEFKDLALLESVTGIYDEKDAFARDFSSISLKTTAKNTPKLAIPLPGQMNWRGKGNYENKYYDTIRKLRSSGHEIIEQDCSVFFDTARLLYEGPWVAERFAAVGEFMKDNPRVSHHITEQIILGGEKYAAGDAFKALYQLAENQRTTQNFFSEFDALVLPTIGGYFSISEEQAEPLAINSYLGTYTNFANLLDLSALSFPAEKSESDTAPPFGITLFSSAGADSQLLTLASSLSKDAITVPLAVCGAHMQGLPLNHQLTSLGGRFRSAETSAPNYRLYALEGRPVPKPGMVADTEDGIAVDLEVWNIPLANLGTFLANVPPPLGIGSVELASGEIVKGFICEGTVEKSATDISDFGGWRNYINQAKQLSEFQSSSCNKLSSILL